MKTFIISILLFIISVTFVVLNMLCINRIADSMLDIAEALPDEVSDFEADYDAVLSETERLWEIWDKNADRLSLTINYDNINRSDDAIAELYTAAKNHDGELFVTAALKFSDNLKRLRKLENFDPGSIF